MFPVFSRSASFADATAAITLQQTSAAPSVYKAIAPGTVPYFVGQVSGDTNYRSELTSSGVIFGPGNATQDVRIYRSGTSALTIDNNAGAGIAVTILGGAITLSAAANTASALAITDGTNNYYVVNTQTTTSGIAAHTLSTTAPTIASAASASWNLVTFTPGTITFTGTTNITTAPNGLAVIVNAPTVTDASAVNVTQPSSVYIAGAPVAAGSVTFVNSGGAGLPISYALNINSGDVAITGSLDFTGATTGIGAAAPTNYLILRGGRTQTFVIADTTTNNAIMAFAAVKGWGTPPKAIDLVSIEPGSFTLTADPTATFSALYITYGTITLSGAATESDFQGTCLRLTPGTITSASVNTLTATSTLYIGGAPTLAGSVTATNNYATYFLSGNTGYGAVHDEIATASIANAYRITDGTNPIISIDTRTTTNAVNTVFFNMGGVTLASASATGYHQVALNNNASVTLTGTTTVPVLDGLQLNIAQPLIKDTQAITVTASSVLNLVGNVRADTNVTITTATILHIQDTAAGAGTVTNGVAILIDALSNGTTKYAVKTQGAGLISVGDTTDSTSSSTGSVVLSGGIGIAKAIVSASTTTATAFIPTGSTVPTNGMYLPAANNLGWATNSAKVMQLDATGILYTTTLQVGGTLGTSTAALQWAANGVAGLQTSGTVSFTNANPFSVTNGQILTVATTAQTVGAATLTIPNFASVSDTFVFITLAQTLANKTLTSPTINGGALSGTFSGTPTFSGAVIFSGTPSFTAANPFTVTNGQVLTIATTAQTVGAATLTIPNFAGVSDTFAFITLAQTFANKTLTSPTINGGALSGTFSGSATLSGATITLSGNTASTSSTTGTLVITGGMGISGRINSNEYIFCDNAADGIYQSNSGLTTHWAVIGNNNTGQAADTLFIGDNTVGAWTGGIRLVAGQNTPSIFIKAGATVLVGIGSTNTPGSTLDINGNLTVGTFGTAAPTGGILAGGTTDASSVSTGTIVSDGGLGVAKNIWGGQGIALALATKTANYTITASDETILGDATAGAITVTLPTAVGITGRIYTIKKKDSSANAVTLASGGGTIDSAASISIGTQNEGVVVQSDGTNWWVIAQVATTIL